MRWKIKGEKKEIYVPLLLKRQEERGSGRETFPPLSFPHHFPLLASSSPLGLLRWHSETGHASPASQGGTTPNTSYHPLYSAGGAGVGRGGVYFWLIFPFSSGGGPTCWWEHKVSFLDCLPTYLVCLFKIGGRRTEATESCSLAMLLFSPILYGVKP